MTVIFQLFCVDDLKMLRQEGRALLLEIIKRGLQAPGTYQQAGELPKICLEASDIDRFNAAQAPPRQVVEALERRIEIVSQQLQAPLPSNPSGLPTLDLSQPIVASARLRALDKPEEDEISRWAISCEINNFNFYYPLLLIKEMAYTMFTQKTGQRPRGPDSAYSPFHERHPLYELFSNLKLINAQHPLYDFFNTLKRPPDSTKGADDASS